MAADAPPAAPACGIALLAALEEARDEASRQQAEVAQARTDVLAAKQSADRVTAALEHLRAERDALAAAVDAFTGAMQTNIHGVAALAQLNSERQRAEELERAAAEATEKASALQAALDAATEKHGHEVLRAQAAHTEQVQRLEGALEATKAEAEEMRKGVAALESELARRAASSAPAPGGGGGGGDSASHQVAALKAKLMAARQEADNLRKELNSRNRTN